MDIDFDSMSDEEFLAYEKTTLMAPDDMASIIQDVCEFIRGDTVANGYVVPRFGLLTLKARRTPMYCYGHEELKKRFPKSYNDGFHIFLSDDFMRTLVEEEDRSNGEREGIIPLVLHHLTHMIMNHGNRFSAFPQEIAAIGADISVYAKLKKAYPDMKWVASLEKEFSAHKLSDTELSKYAKMAEETIIRELLQEYKKKLEEQEQNADDEQKQESGSKSTEKSKTSKSKKDSKASKDKPSGEKSEDKNADGSPEEQESDNDSNQESGQGTESSDAQSMQAKQKALKEAMKKMKLDPNVDVDEQDHNLNLQESVNLMEEMGLSGTKKNLDMPEPWDYEKMEAKEHENKITNLEDIQKSMKIAGQAGTAGGGSGLEGGAYEEAMKDAQGKLSWKMAMQQVVGASLKYGYTEEEPGDIYYIDPKDMGLDNEIYVGADLPMKSENVVMVLMDSSGSITEDLMRTFLNEIFGLIKSENPESSAASEVILLFADDVLRGKPILITEQNVEELLEKNKLTVQGRGGNDIGGTIRQALALPEFEEKKVEALIYFTDLGDAPPKKTDVKQGVPLVFVCPPDYYNEEFCKAVKDFAKVYPIEEGLEVDLTRDGYLEAEGSKQLPKSRKMFW